MKNSVKRVTKKALSFLLAVAMMFSVLSVAITALANEVEIVYTVTKAKPAIPAQQGKVIDLRKIAVEIGNDTYRGTDLEWSTNDTTGGIIVGNGVIAMLGSDIYAVEAVVPNTGKKQTVYITETDNGTFTIYHKTFEASDIQNDSNNYGSLTSASEWKFMATSTDTDVNNIWFDNGIYTFSTPGVNTGFFYLDPDSVSGKRVSDFPDFVMEASFSGAHGSNEGDVGVLFHITFKDGARDDFFQATTYARTSATGEGHIRYAHKEMSTATPYKKSAVTVVKQTAFNARYTVDGNTVKSEYDIDADGVYEETDLLQSTPTTYDYLANVKGTIGAYSNRGIRPKFKSVTVTVALDTSKMSEYLKDEEIYVVSASKPALPMYEGQKLDLSKLFFEFDNGVVAGGSQIAWDCKAEGIEVNNSDKTITVLKNGMYEVAAAYAKAGDQPKTFYVITPDENNEKVLLDYTFTSADAGLAATDANGKPVWSYSGGGSWSWKTNVDSWYTVKGPRLRNDGGAGVIYLNPESEAGKIVSSFADYTFYLTAVTHENWTGGAQGAKYFPMLTRYNMAGDTYSLTNDTYLGYRAYFSTTGGSVYVAGSAVANSTTTWAYTNDYPHSDFKLKVEGSEVIFSAKPANASEYTQVFKMSDAGTVPAAVLNTVGKAGTIGVYTDTQNRPSLQKAKVVLSFSDEEIKEISDRCSEILLIKTSDDSLTIGKGKKLDLNDIYFQFKDGTCKSGSDINISTEDKTGGIVVDNENKSVALLGSDIYKITLSADADTSRTIFVLTPNANNEFLLYEHTFSAKDVDTTNKTFVSDSEWTLLDGVAALAVDSSGYITTNSTAANYVLKPTSESAKKIAGFRDIIMEASISFTNQYGTAGQNFMMGVRANWADNSAQSGYPATYVGGGYRTSLNHDGQDYAYTSISGNSKQFLFDGYYKALREFRTYKISAIGDTFELYRNNVNVKDNVSATLHTTGVEPTAEQTAAMSNTKAGYIWFRSLNTDRIILKDVKVKTVFAQEYIDAIAQYTSDALLIEAGSPIIPVTRTYKVDLSDIYFEFNNGYVALGKDIAWSTTDTTGGVLVANVDKTIALLGDKMYEVTAIYNGETKTFFVAQPDGNNQIEIYYHPFEDTDVDTSTKNFVANSDWTLLEGGGNLVWNSLGGVQTGSINTSRYALKPTSEKGKLVASFRDVVIETNIAFPIKFNNANSSYAFTLQGRANWADNSAISGSPVTYAGGGYNGANYLGYDWVTSTVSGKTNSHNFSTYDTAENTFYNYKVELIGNDVKLYKNGVKAPLTMTADQNAAITATKAGSIYIYNYNTRMIIKDIKVSAVVKENIVKALTARQTSLTVVPAGNPAIPMAEGTALDVSDIFFEFDKGAIISGASIVWESDSSAVTVDNEANTIILTKNATTAIRATFEGQPDKTIYLVQPDSNNKLVLLDYTFSAADNNLAAKDSSGNAIWLSTGDAGTAWNWNAAVGYANVNARLQDNTNAGVSVIYLNPESEAGKIVSSFADYTFYLTAVTHQNWVAQGKMCIMLTRYNMAGATYNLANDTYLGYRAYFGSNGGAVYAGNANAATSSATWGYNSSYPNIDFKLKVAGGDIEFSAKSTVDTAYNLLYKTSDSNPAPAAALATKGKAGTIAVYSDKNNRPGLQKAKVEIEIDSSIVEYSKKNSKEVEFISADMPILPMEKGTKLNLGNIYFEFDNGKLVSGQNITWTTDSATGFYLNDSDKSLSMFKAPAEKELYVITASAEGVEPKTFYAFVPDANNEYVIYDKTFKKEDLDEGSDGSLFKDSEWVYDPVSPDFDAEIGYGDTFVSVNWNESASGLMPYGDTGSGYTINDKVRATMFLRPESESGQLVSNFRNVVVDFTVNSTQTWTHDGSGFVGPIARFVLADDIYEDKYKNYPWDDWAGTDEARSTSVSRVESFWRAEGKDGNVIKASKTAVTVGINGETTKATRSDGVSVDWVQQSFVFKGNNTVSVQRLKVVGNTVEAYVKASNEATFNKAEFTMTDAMSSAINNTTAGTIGFYWGTTSRVAVQSAKVSIVATDDEKAFIKDNSEPINTVSVIPANKPALPATVDTMIKLSGFYVEFNNGAVVPASEITWSSLDASKAYVDDIVKTVTILKSGTSTIKASYAGEEKLIHLVTANANGEYAIYDHKFSSADITYANSSYGEFTAASEWKLYDMGRGAGYTDVAGIKGYSQGIVVTNVASSGYVDAALYLDPDSASGKRVSAFADMTLLINASSTEGGNVGNWVGPYLHLNLGTNGAVDSTAQYSSPRFIVRSGTGFLRNYLPSGTSDIAGSTGTPLTGGSAFALRYTINGKSVTAESDVGGAGTFDALARTYTDNNLPVSGTIGLYSANNVRPVFTSVTVTITFSNELKQLVENNSQAVSLIQKDKPAIPMDIGQTLDLSILTLTDKNGNLIDGKLATWTISDESAYLVYDDISNTITSFSAGYATLTATDKGTGNTAVVYLTVANSKGEYVIYQHTFSAGDLVEKSGYNVFTEDSEWYAKNLSVEGGENELRLGYRVNQAGSTHIYEGLTTSYSNSGSDPTINYTSLIYLRPESASGIKVSSFSDFTLDYSAGFWGNNPDFTGPLLRMQLDEDGNRTNYTNPHFYYRNAGSPTWFRLYDNGARISGGDSNITYSDGSNVEVVKGQRNWFSYAVNGNDLTIKVATDANYSDAFTLQVNSAGGATVTSADGKTNTLGYSAYKFANISGGTIGFSYRLLSPYGLYDIAVKLTFTDEEKAYLSRFVSDFEDITVKEYEDITQYREGSKFTAPIAPYNKVFAGWYMDEACTVALKSDEDYTGRAFAKFVNDDMFSVKWQITNPSDATRNGKVDLRLVTSIDSLRYNAMAFEIIRVKGDKRQKAVIETNEVFKNILGDDGFKAYDPTVFTDVSKYFATGRITNTDWTAWGDGTYYVTVMLETLDGTIVRVDNEMHRFKMNYDDRAIDIAEKALREQIYKLEDTVEANAIANRTGDIFYVSNDGSDSNPGTKESPFATFKKAYNSAGAGDTILFKRGGTYRMVYNKLENMDGLSIGAYGEGEKPLILGSADIKSGITKLTEIDSFKIDGDDERQAGLNTETFTAPAGTKLYSVDLTGRLATDSDVGAIFFVEAGDKVTAADKKWHRSTEHKLYNEDLDALDAPYDFFYDFNNKMAYVLLPEDKTPSDYEAIEALGLENVFIVNSNNVTIENLEIRYGNFGVVVYGVDGTTLRGLEIGWIGGNRQSDLGNYNLQGYNGQYVRLGNGIENWGAGSNFTIDQCYVYECYDAGITFQNNTQKTDNYGKPYYKSSVFENIKFTNNLLTRNIYNIEYFQSHANGKDDTYIKNILFEGNICRDAGGTAEDPMWASLYRPDKGVAANIKGSTTGNNTMLTDGNGNYQLEAADGFVSSFVIKNNIFDGSYDNSIMHFSAANKGGAPIFEGNLVVGEGTQTITVDRKSYSIKDFVKKFDAEQGGSVVKSQSTASAVFASQRTFNTWGAVKETNALNNTKYLLETKKAIKVGYLGGSVTDGTNANNWVEDDNYQADLDSWRALTTQWLHQEYPDASVAEIMASQGGTASYWAFHRLETDLLVYKPDLVFIDFAVNDNYSGLTATESALYMEGIVKKLRAANPNVDIVFVIVADNQNYIAETGSQDAQWVDAHYAVANHYGIPVIDVRDSIAKDNTVDLKNNWDTYFSDSVHPSKAGYAKYAEYVRTELETILANASADVYAENEMPEGDYVSNLATSSEFRRMDKVTIEDKDGKTVALSGTEGTRLGAKVEEVAMLHDGDVIKTSFTGKTLGFYLDSYADNLADGSKVTFSILIDGKTTVVAPQYKGGYNIEYIALDNLAPGRHTVEITVVSTDEKPIAIGGLLIAK